MSNEFNNIRIKDWAWIHFGDQYVSFGWKGLPEDVHFTIAFNDSSEDVNFHITRNREGENGKPKIEIVRINKTLLSKIFEENVFSLLSVFLEPFDVSTYQNMDSIYLPYEVFQDGESGKISHELFVESFKELIQIKKRRVKIDGDIEGKIKEVSTSEPFIRNMIDNLQPLPLAGDGKLYAGMILNDNGYDALICIQSRWHKLKLEINHQDLMKVLVEPGTVRNLRFYFLRSLARIKYANNSSETLPFSQPIILRRNEKIDLRKDIRWELVESAKTFDEFQKNLIRDFFLNEKVPADVKEHLQIARKILVHSYFAYEFIDIAFTQVIIGFEKALKKRFKEITNKDGEKLSLQRLIDWGFKLGLFERSESELLHAYRCVRNGKVHSSYNTLGGLVYLGKVTEPLMFINDLYEDIELRKQRRAHEIAMTDKLLRIISGGGIMEMNEQNLVIVHAFVLFVNNKTSKLKYHIAIVPAFDLQPLRQGQHFMANVLELAFDEYESDDLSLSFKIADGSKIILRRANDVESAILTFWNNQFKELGIDGQVVMSTVPYKLDEYYKKILDSFYRL